MKQDSKPRILHFDSDGNVSELDSLEEAQSMTGTSQHVVVEVCEDGIIIGGVKGLDPRSKAQLMEIVEYLGGRTR